MQPSILTQSDFTLFKRECKPTRYSKVDCNCTRCQFVNRFNAMKPSDCKCVKCKKFHLEWMRTPVCEKCLEEK